VKRRTTLLPDLPDDDAAFAERLRPLASKLLPPDKSRDRKSEIPDSRLSGSPRQTSASRRDEIEAKRGPKKRFEYVLPVRVGEALAEDARKRGQSATTRLLKVLRNSGYPVIQEDLIDLRVESSRK